MKPCNLIPEIDVSDSQDLNFNAGIIDFTIPGIKDLPDNVSQAVYFAAREIHNYLSCNRPKTKNELDNAVISMIHQYTDKSMVSLEALDSVDWSEAYKGEIGTKK